MIDLNPGHMRREEAAEAISAAVDAALVARAETQARRSYLGASAIGQPCERRVQYEYLHTDHDADYQPEARTQRIFARGHLGEDMMAEWLRAAGYDLRTEKDGRQYRFETAGGRFAGHIDGVVMAGPGIETPAIWEHKCLGNKSFSAIDRNGVAKSKPEYADQIAVYQAYFDLTAPALFTALNMDTMTVHYELVKFDRRRAQAASDRAVAIIQDSEAGALRPRASDDSDFWICRNCPFRARCHGL